MHRQTQCQKSTLLSQNKMSQINTDLFTEFPMAIIADSFFVQSVPAVSHARMLTTLYSRGWAMIGLRMKIWLSSHHKGIEGALVAVKMFPVS